MKSNHPVNWCVGMQLAVVQECDSVGFAEKSMGKS